MKPLKTCNSNAHFYKMAEHVPRKIFNSGHYFTCNSKDITNYYKCSKYDSMNFRALLIVNDNIQTIKRIHICSMDIKFYTVQQNFNVSGRFFKKFYK